MSIFNKLFKKNKEDNYIDLDSFKNINTTSPKQEMAYTDLDVGSEPNPGEESDSVSKSFTNGRAESRTRSDGLGVVGMTAPTQRGNELPKDYYIRRKQLLYNFATGNEVAQAIIRTRTSQIRKFAVPARETADGIGYHIIPRDQEGKKTTKKQEKEIRDLEDFIYNTGKSYKSNRDKFESFLTKLVFDHYTYDQVNIERLFESPKSDKLNHFNLADAGTILIHRYPKSIDANREFAQLIDNKVVHKFSERNMTFDTYWNNGDVRNFGYGYSPVEASMAHLGYFNDTEQFNARFFKQGGTTRGLLVINAGDNQYSQVALDGLRRTWTNLKGVNGAWKIPVMTAADAKFVNMTQSSKDMEFSEWLNYLTNIISAIFQINPEEINFPNKGGGATGKGGGATFESKGATKDRNNASKEKGLSPLLRFIEGIINDEILRYVNKDYRFEFTMGDTGEEQRKQELLSAKLKNGMLLNEARKENGLPTIPEFDTPGDATAWVQYQTILAKSDPEASNNIQHSNDQDPNNGEVPDPKDKPDNEQDQNSGSKPPKQPLPKQDSRG